MSISVPMAVLLDLVVTTEIADMMLLVKDNRHLRGVDMTEVNGQKDFPPLLILLKLEGGGGSPSEFDGQQIQDRQKRAFLPTMLLY